MRIERRGGATSVIGLCLLFGTSLAWLIGTRTGSPAIPEAASPFTTAPRGQFEQAMREAWQRRTRAKIAVNRQLEAIEEWDSQATARGAQEWRAQELAADRQGYLQCALVLAKRGAAQARTTSEHSRAAALLARIACDLGDHQQELAHARKLARLIPNYRQARDTLWHAALCNGLQQVAPEAASTLDQEAMRDRGGNNER
jgi:hypothetical protein